MAGNVFAEPVITATINGDIYAVGDLITLKVDVSDNPGFHSIFFDMDYNGTVLSFEGIREGLLIQREILDGNFYYAVNDESTSNIHWNHVIVSYALEGAGSKTPETGNLVTIQFRVISPGSAHISYTFNFNSTGVFDGDGNEILGAVWNNSNEFTIGTVETGNFISISEPYENQVFFTEEIEINAICTNDEDLTVVLSNLNTEESIGSISAATGVISGEMIGIDYGYNRINADLFDEYGNIVATDSVAVFRSEDEKFVKIIKPTDHSLVNTDMVELLIASATSNLKVNNRTDLEAMGEKYDGKDVYRLRLWLKKGFNSITAEATAESGAFYKDSITIFYYKEDSVFNFVSPLSGTIYKAGTDNWLEVTGEIDSRYSDIQNGNTENSKLNTVVLKVIYYPNNPLYSPLVIAKDIVCEIKETTIEGTTAGYMFYNLSAISLEGYESGKLEIIAYKNKESAYWENEIHRFVYIDNSKLWIDLIQPKIYGEDILDTEYKLNRFNTTENSFTNTILEENGTFKLTETDEIVTEETTISGREVVKIIELIDGSIVSMVNERDVLKLFKKEFGSNSWDLLYEQNDTYGYDICETSMGILLGVSNLFSSENSGLYILQGNTVKNITIGEPISHVQFIKNNNGMISLYGNKYSHLYSFNIYSLEEDNGRLATYSISGIPFDNNLSISQFELSKDLRTAVIRTIEGEVLFFRYLKNFGFIREYFDRELFDPGLRFNQIVLGEYEDGNYNTYLLLEENGDYEKTIVIMENRSNNTLIATPLLLGVKMGLVENEIILGSDFRDDSFWFLTKDSNTITYFIKKGQI